MDLSGYFQTTATLAPILAVSCILYYRTAPPPKTRNRARLREAGVYVPAAAVTLTSVGALGGIYPESRVHVWIVFIVLWFQVMFGLLGMVADAGAAPQPHKQPHKPEPTGPDPTQPTNGHSGSEQAKQDETAPEQTATRHS